jgi:hypothetical protein
MMRDQRRLRRAAAVLALLCGLAWLGSCQNDNPSRPPIEIVTPQPVRGVIAQTSFGNFANELWFALPIQVSQKGVLDITVDWTMPDSWIYVYFGRQNCDYNELTGKTCPFLISSETQLPKPRVLITDTLEAGTYYVFLYNVPKNRRLGIGSDNSETVSLVVGLTISPSGQSAPGAVRVGKPTVVQAPHF